MWLTGPAAPRHVGSSQTRARTRVPCIGRQILNHCTTREAHNLYFYRLNNLASQSLFSEALFLNVLLIKPPDPSPFPPRYPFRAVSAFLFHIPVLPTSLPECSYVNRVITVVLNQNLQFLLFNLLCSVQSNSSTAGGHMWVAASSFPAFSQSCGSVRNGSLSADSIMVSSPVIRSSFLNITLSSLT